MLFLFLKFGGFLLSAYGGAILDEVFSFSANPTPSGGLVLGSNGVMYGATYGGGDNGCGTVFCLSTNGLISTLVSLDNARGANPAASLVWGPDGALYGTARRGGANSNGTIFRVSIAGELSRVYSFSNGTATYPISALVCGSDGSLYGTTYYGGPNGYGTIYRITTNGTFRILASLPTFEFKWSYPCTELVEGNDGAFYGATAGFGPGLGGDGALFRITTNGELRIIYDFGVSLTKINPLARGSDGALYRTGGLYGTAGGTAFRLDNRYGVYAVSARASMSNGFFASTLMQGADGLLYGADYSRGIVFNLTTNLIMTPLTFESYGPRSQLVQSSDGVLFGTGYGGVVSNLGAVYRVTTNGSMSIVAAFSSPIGSGPQSSLLEGTDGAFYGTTVSGGIYGYGTVFKLSTNGIASTVVAFAGTNGASPYAPLCEGSDGALYGATRYGGLPLNNSGPGAGTIFRLTKEGTLTTLTPHKQKSTATGCLLEV